MKKGFTILELLVVLIIISLVAAFVAPRILSPNNNLRLKTTVNKIASALRYASNVAATGKKEMAVVVDMQNRKIYVMPAQGFVEKFLHRDNKNIPEGANEFNFSEDIIYQEDFSTIEKIRPDIFIVYFFPNGSSSGGDIVLGNDRGLRYKIKIDFITSIINIDRM